MDCNKVMTRLADVRHAARVAQHRLGNGDSTGVNNQLLLIEMYLAAIRTEMTYNYRR